MPNVNSLEYQRTLQKQEKAVELVDIWTAILDAGEAIKALGGSYPDEHIRKAQDALLRAGKLATGDLTDDVIKAIATVGTARIWAASMGQVFAGETIIDGTSGETYICTVTHQAQALYAPGTEGGRTLFRLIREEPEEPGTYLDFAWGEHVPYGAVRRDPIDGKLYTPIKEAGVTLYEPHYPRLVPSEYKLYEDGGEEPEPGPEPEPEPGDVPDWDGLEESHTFAVGDHFTHDGTEYEVLRAFNKQENWAPPALLNDYYKEVSAYAVTDKAYAALLDLVTDICRRNGAKKLLWFGDKAKTLAYTPKSGEMVMTVHRWFANKSCPGAYLYERHGAIAEEVTRRLGGGSSTPSTPTTDSEQTATNYTVKVTATDLNIRSGPGTNYGRKGFIAPGVYTIVAEADGTGATKWGKLKSGVGWISLDYVTKTGTGATAAPAIKVGSKVTIDDGAVYGGLATTRGKAVPSGVSGPNRKYTVKQLATHKGEEEALLQEIVSWVALKYLNAV